MIAKGTVVEIVTDGSLNGRTGVVIKHSDLGIWTHDVFVHGDTSALAEYGVAFAESELRPL